MVVINNVYLFMIDDYQDLLYFFRGEVSKFNGTRDDIFLEVFTIWDALVLNIGV